MNEVLNASPRFAKEELLVPLALLREGEVAIIHSFPEELTGKNFYPTQGMGECSGNCLRRHKRGLCQRIMSMGLKIGQTVEIKQNQPGQPILIKIDDAYLALSRGIAKRIIVRIKPNS